jgi:hypothetical protein
MSLRVLVNITELDPNGESVEATEVWSGVDEAGRAFLAHCQDVESREREWGRGMFDKFCKMRAAHYRPHEYSKLKNATLDDYVEITIHYDNADEIGAADSDTEGGPYVPDEDED